MNSVPGTRHFWPRGVLPIVMAAAMLALTIPQRLSRGADAPKAPPAPALVAVDHVRFYPAPQRAKAMLGGKIAGSNVSRFEGFKVLAEITSVPPEGQWTDLAFNNKTPYRWVRYEAPAGSRGNVAELEFYAGDRKLHGGGFGTAGQLPPGGHWKTVFDGKLETWFNSSDPDGQYVGLDLEDQASTARPALVPGFGDYETGQKIVMKDRDADVAIRYTLDGTAPGIHDGLLYSGPIDIQKISTVTAVAFKEGLACSPPTQGTYLIGAPTRPAMNSFHIGNSLTGNTARFPLYARTAGAIDHYSSFLMGGALTVNLWKHKEGDEKQRWEQIVGKLTLPLDNLTVQPRDFNVAQEADYAVRFFNLMREKSPDVQPWLYAEWVEKERRRPSDAGVVPSSQMSKTYPALTWEESMSAMLLYNEEVQKLINERDHAGKRVKIIPSDIAMGWARNLLDHNKIHGIPGGEASFYATFFEDSVHVSPIGSYLVDLTWYSAFYGQSPEGKVLPIGTTLTAEQAGILQRLAWDVVKNYPGAGLYEQGTTPVESPTASPAPGEVGDVTPVTLSSATPGAWFRYTLDGTTPTRTRGYVYCGVVSVRPGMTLSAIAYKSGMADSGVLTVTYPAKEKR